MSPLELDLELCQGGFRLRARITAGPRLAVLGPSGAGKTSLLEAIAGLRRGRGRVVVAGEVLQDTGLFLPPERRRVGLVPQDGALFPHLSVRANLLFGVRGVHTGAAGSAVGLEEVVAVLDLAPLLERRPRHLSGGEARRVALGRALLSSPRLLLLDEPTAGLDPVRARRARGYLSAVARRTGMPWVVVTHREDEARALADEVVLLEGGRVTAQGPVAEVLARREVLTAQGEEHPDAVHRDNLVRGLVLSHDSAGGVTRVEIPGPAADAPGTVVSIPPHPEMAVGSAVALAVSADEVLVATEEPRGLSARNAVSGRVEALVPAAGSVWVRVGDWLARLTPAAVAELELAEGRPVWLVVKTHSWRVVEEGC